MGYFYILIPIYYFTYHPIFNGNLYNGNKGDSDRGSKTSTAEGMLYHMPTYNKLVRDKIPHIITSSGKECRTRILDSEEYKQELRTKLQEESDEYVKAASDQEALEELADMLEVIRALAEVHGANAAQLDKLRADKAEARGAFQERVYLIDVDEA
ncbi:putative house-cleaning noncanonical NTP pyrophosphatase (MazG superfamily) [Paenibacillus sp. DS2363]